MSNKIARGRLHVIFRRKLLSVTHNNHVKGGTLKLTIVNIHEIAIAWLHTRATSRVYAVISKRLLRETGSWESQTCHGESTFRFP